MTLLLRAVSLDDHPLTQPIVAQFDARGGSVGRSEHNTLALPDPERHISRTHAEISISGKAYAIKNVGSANPITVRGQSLSRGESATLAHSDEVRIGGYLLQVIDEDAADDNMKTIVRGRSTPEASAIVRQGSARFSGGRGPRTSPPVPSAAFNDLNAPLSSSNPFASLLADATPASGPAASPEPARERLDERFLDRPQAAAGIPTGSAAWAPQPAAPGRPLLPPDFDPFAASPIAATASTPSPSRGDPFDDLVPRAVPSSIDQAFGLSGGAGDPLADFMSDLASPRPSDLASTPGARPLSTDPLALFGVSPVLPAAVDALPTPPDHVPELRASFVPPAVRALQSPNSDAGSGSGDAARHPTPAGADPQPLAPAIAAEPPTASPTVAEPGDAPAGTVRRDPRGLWAAFCEGAGIDIDLAQGPTPEMMHVAGGVLRAAVEGAWQLMMVRATAKHELRAQVTTIRARDNNPLKFSPDARSAMDQLLLPPLRGFLAGPDAMTDAMHDLIGHTIATMAGTRAALEGVLDRFTPQQLEAQLVGKSVLDSVLPMARKARLWELYLQHFDAIRNEAQDDFHTLFGKAFLAAYEQQVDRLQRPEPPPPR